MNHLRMRYGTATVRPHTRRPGNAVLPFGSATALRQLLPSIAPDGSNSTPPFVVPHVVSRTPVLMLNLSEMKSFRVPVFRP